MYVYTPPPPPPKPDPGLGFKPLTRVLRWRNHRRRRRRTKGKIATWQLAESSTVPRLLTFFVAAIAARHGIRQFLFLAISLQFHNSETPRIYFCEILGRMGATRAAAGGACGVARAAVRATTALSCQSTLQAGAAPCNQLAGAPAPFQPVEASASGFAAGRHHVARWTRGFASEAATQKQPIDAKDESVKVQACCNPRP